MLRFDDTSAQGEVKYVYALNSTAEFKLNTDLTIPLTLNDKKKCGIVTFKQGQVPTVAPILNN